jgi:hypothetical protein
MFEETKGVQTKRDRRTKHDLQNTTQKRKDWATRIPLKSWGEIRCSGRVSNCCSACSTRCVTLFTKPVIGHKCYVLMHCICITKSSEAKYIISNFMLNFLQRLKLSLQRIGNWRKVLCVIPMKRVCYLWTVDTEWRVNLVQIKLTIVRIVM